VTSPLVLIGRSPLCDVVLRTPGINSVQFIMEWIGTGEFSSAICSEEEWVVTEVAQAGIATEKKLNKTATGEGFIFHIDPIQIDKYGFYWKEDRLAEADLSKKMISQQLTDYKGASASPYSAQAVSSILEVICLSREVDAVSEIFHYNLNSKSFDLDDVIGPFEVRIEGKSQKKAVSLRLPTDSSCHLIRQGRPVDQPSDVRITIETNDLLHVEWESDAYYFRLVPRVAVPAARRSIFSDPFYVITTLCLLVGFVGLYFIFKNVKNIKKPLTPPPRIAVVEVKEVAHPKPVEKEKPKPIPPQEKPPEPPHEEVKEKLKSDKPKMAQVIPNQMPSPRQQDNPKKSPLTEKNKGGLDNDAQVSKNNVVGFLSGIKKPKTLGLVKADQILAKGVVSETVAGKDAEVFLDQSAQGLVNKDTRMNGENLAAASTKLNLKDKVGMNSLEGAETSALKKGFSISYGDSNANSGSGLGKDTDVGVETSVEGGLDKASVKAAIRGYASEIRTCYERALRVKSNINGRVVYKFQIAPAGNTQWVQIHKSSIDSPTLANCVQEVLKIIKFPVAKNGQSTVVIYPFQFNKKGS
jgi:outer membrane biosynthesis protein TonB